MQTNEKRTHFGRPCRWSVACHRRKTRNEIKMRQLNQYRNVTVKMLTYPSVSSVYFSSEKSAGQLLSEGGKWQPSSLFHRSKMFPYQGIMLLKTVFPVLFALKLGMTLMNEDCILVDTELVHIHAKQFHIIRTYGAAASAQMTRGEVTSLWEWSDPSQDAQ